MEFLAALGALAGLYVLLRKDILDVKQDLKADILRVEDRLGVRIHGQDGRFDTIDDRFDTIDDRFDRVDARFDRVDDRFDRLEAKIDQVRGELITHLQKGHPPAA